MRKSLLKDKAEAKAEVRISYNYPSIHPYKNSVFALFIAIVYASFNSYIYYLF